MVAVRQNSSGITNSSEYTFTSIAGNPFYSNQNISNVFMYPYFPKNYIRKDYTVFIHALNCQGNIVMTKSFEVFYTGQRLFDEAPGPIYRD